MSTKVANFHKHVANTPKVHTILNIWNQTLWMMDLNEK